MELMDDLIELQSYIRSSRYRMEVLRTIIEEGPIAPTSIAELVEIKQPHVSKTLQELRDRQVIELAVPESQTKGRLYQPTETGEELWIHLRGLEWQGQLHDVPDPYREIVTRLEDHFEEELLVVGHFDGNDIENYYLKETFRREVPEEEFVEGVKRLVTEYSHEGTEVGSFAGNLTCEVQFLTKFIRIVIYEDTGFLAIGLNPEARSEFPSILESCKEVME